MQTVELNQNALSLVSVAKGFARQMGDSREEVNNLEKELLAGDNDHLKTVFKAKFRHVCKFIDNSQGHDDE